jgi:hypothetical protein
MVRASFVGLLFIVTGCVRSQPVVAPTVVLVSGVNASVPIATGGGSSEAHASFDPQDEVEVEWRGSWWPAVVLEQRGARWLVHYEGYGNEWDEVVARERIRERSAPRERDEPPEADEPNP